MVADLRCVKCGSPLERASGAGRPPTYCGDACKRLVEYEVRRIDRRLSKYEDELREEQADRNGADHRIDNLGRTRTQRINDLRKWIQADEERLAQLLGNRKSN